MKKFNIGDLVVRDSDLDEPRTIYHIKAFDTSSGLYTIKDLNGYELGVGEHDITLVRSEEDIRASMLKKDGYETPSDQTVAIVSFEGAVKREIKRVVSQLRIVESLSNFRVIIRASGELSADSMKLEFEVGPEYGDKVTSNSLQEAVTEFMRRHGWDEMHKIRQVTFNGVPD